MAAQVQVKISLPKGLTEKLEPLLLERDLTLDEVVRLYLRALVTTSERSRALDLRSEMPLGKFKGEELAVVIRSEPKYVSWLLAEVEGFKLAPDALALLEQVQKEAEK